MREYSVVWLRQGNSTPRRKRIGPSLQRAKAYLHAVQSMTAEERYGTSVDKYKCCDGGGPYDPCTCEGKTWRDHWEDKFGRLLNGDPPILSPLVYARIDSRPVAKWEPTDGDGAMPDHKYGELVAPPESKANWMVVDPARAVALNLVDGVLMHYGPRWTYRDE